MAPGKDPAAAYRKCGTGGEHGNGLAGTRAHDCASVPDINVPDTAERGGDGASIEGQIPQGFHQGFRLARNGRPIQWHTGQGLKLGLGLGFFST